MDSKELMHLRHLAEVAEKLHSAVEKSMVDNLGEEVTKTIQQHAMIGAAAGAIPITGVDMIAVVTNVWTMYVRINDILGLPFSKNLMKSISTAILTNVAGIIPGFLLSKLAGGLAKLFPGIGTFGGMVIDGATNYALTTVMGTIYVTALHKLYASGTPLTDENLRKAAAEASSDKASVVATFDEAKSSYKPQAT